MITESVVVDVSQDWVAACGLQERSMEIPCVKHKGSPPMPAAGRCARSAVIASTSYPCPAAALGLPSPMRPVKDFPRRSL